MLLEVNLTRRMETATIEQIHRVKHLPIRTVEKLPAIKKARHLIEEWRNNLSRDQGITKACAFKEFRFEPPYVSRKKERKKKKLPPIPEHMLPKRHNSFEETDYHEEETDGLSDLPTLPSLSISPAYLTERVDERSLSVEVLSRSPHFHLYNTREFTFPESSAKRKKQLPSQPSIVPALTPRVREIPVQAKIEKLAKQKRKDRAKRAIERRYEKKLHNMSEIQSPTSHMAFKNRREPDIANSFHLKEQKLSPFKQMVRVSDEGDKTNRLNPRLYTRIVDSIYTYTKGIHGHTQGGDSQSPYERIMVTPVTLREDVKDHHNDHNKTLTTFLPPI